jgi:hypothetical protein
LRDKKRRVGRRGKSVAIGRQNKFLSGGRRALKVVVARVSGSFVLLNKTTYQYLTTNLIAGQVTR